ncbi:hypothetical protein HKCCSP123_07945 [Rhodobacterales bacterium HKCCSP123]|nr:hypothetical protein [Rhodobacterales bacterium HKCCSP123]
MTPLTPENQAQDDPLAPIRRSFLGHLGDRCLAIDAILERDGGRGIGREEREVIIHHAHRTAGLAASLGFETLGRLASAVESAWTRTPPGDDGTGPALEVTLRFLDEIERVLDEDLVA